MKSPHVLIGGLGGAPGVEVVEVGQQTLPDRRPPAGLHVEAVSRLGKEEITLAAKLARVGLELHVVRKAGGVVFYEVRRDAGQAFTCSTLHGAAALLAMRTGGAA